MHKRNNFRTQRIGDQMKRELAQLLQFEVKDPRVGMVTIIEVEVTKDLSHAKIFFSVFNENDVKESLIGLQQAAGFLRSQLAKLIKLRTMPELHFIYDDSIVKAQRISSLIDTALAEDATNPIEEEPKDKQG